MAKVATQGPVSSNAILIGRNAPKAGTAFKRKTPSELRGEQLKRKNSGEVVDESPAPAIGFQKTSIRLSCGLKKSDVQKNPRYIETRMNDVYPTRKNNFMLKVLSRKENTAENPGNEQGAYLKNCSVPSNTTDGPQLSRLKESSAPNAVTSESAAQSCKVTESCDKNTFRSVTQLSSSGDKLPGLGTVDLDKALRGLIAHEPPRFSGLADSSANITNFGLQNLFPEFDIPLQKTPLDFTLKTTLRVASSSSVNWFHRFITSGSYGGMLSFADSSQKLCSPELSSSSKAVMPRMLHSWVYPQTSFPASVMSVLSKSAGDGVQMDFFSKRQSVWEDAFRSLYYMLRNGVCNIFYVCTAQFVVMFICDCGTKGSKPECSAYLSQSSRSLRSSLKEHDISFSMPLCHSKIEQTTTEELVELSEIEKHNLGQIRRQGSMANVDNSPESLLAFSGNKNVHGLYDFLLNYRSFLTSLSGVDVPVLYSPMPFLHSAHSSPEVKCKEVRKADCISFPKNEPYMKDEPSEGSASGFCYSIEIKDAYLPPWLICSVLEAMSSEGTSFEASFVTESTSTGLNIPLETIFQANPKPTEAEVSKSPFGIPNATLSPYLRSAYLKGLKFNNGSYTASVSRI